MRARSTRIVTACNGTVCLARQLGVTLCAGFDFSSVLYLADRQSVCATDLSMCISVSIVESIVTGINWRTRTKKIRTSTRCWEQNSVHSTELHLWLILGRSSARLCIHGTWRRCCPCESESVRGPTHRREVHKHGGTKMDRYILAVF